MYVLTVLMLCKMQENNKKDDKNNLKDAVAKVLSEKAIL